MMCNHNKKLNGGGTCLYCMPYRVREHRGRSNSNRSTGHYEAVCLHHTIKNDKGKSSKRKKTKNRDGEKVTEGKDMKED